jgi:hypothetical protein
MFVQLLRVLSCSSWLLGYYRSRNCVLIGGFQYMISGGNDTKTAEARQLILPVSLVLPLFFRLAITALSFLVWLVQRHGVPS